MSTIDPWTLRVPCECGSCMRLDLVGKTFRCDRCPRAMSRQLVRNILLSDGEPRRQQGQPAPTTK